MSQRCTFTCLLLTVLVVGCNSPDESEGPQNWTPELSRLQEIGELGSEEQDDFAFALDRLENGNASERSLAAWAMGANRHVPAVPLLRAALDDPDKNVRANAIGAIFALGLEDWPELTAKALADRDPFVQQATLSLMPDLTPESLVQPIGKLLANSSDESVRIGAADALGKVNSDAAVPVLKSNIGDESKDVRVHIAFALGKSESPSAVPVLASMLEDESWEVRANACQALGRFKTPDALDAIRGLLDDPNTQVRGVAQSFVTR